MPQAAYVRCNEDLSQLQQALDESFNAASGICSLQLHPRESPMDTEQKQVIWSETGFYTLFRYNRTCTSFSNQPH